MFWYLPLPRYQERYTEYVSGHNGVFESALKELGIEFESIRPSNDLHTISTGVVLDVDVMTQWAFSQVYSMVRRITEGIVKEGDTIHCEDFWTPGFEQIPYALSMVGLYGKVKLSSYCFAQSVDQNDFTYKLMRDWIPAFEEARVNCFDKIFCASPDHADLMIDEWGCQRDNFPKASWDALRKKIVAVGTMFNSEHLRDHYRPDIGHGDTRQRVIIYSSRLHEEKDPEFLLAVAADMYKLDKKIEFHICTGSNALNCAPHIAEAIAKAPNIQVFLGLAKIEYYKRLCYAAVQFNCAKQDFVSYTLLEAATFECTPFYPSNNESFGPALGHSKELLYDKNEGSLRCAVRLLSLVERHAGERIKYGSQNQLRWIYSKYDFSVLRMMSSLGLTHTMADTPLEALLKWTENEATMYDMAHK